MHEREERGEEEKDDSLGTHTIPAKEPDDGENYGISKRVASKTSFSRPVALLLLLLTALVRVEPVRAWVALLALARLDGLARLVPGRVAIAAVEALLRLLDAGRTTLRLTRAGTTGSADVGLALAVLVRSFRRAALAAELSAGRHRALSTSCAETHEALTGGTASAVQRLAIVSTLEAGADVALLVMTLVTHSGVVVLLAGAVKPGTVRVALALRSKPTGSDGRLLGRRTSGSRTRRRSRLEHGGVLDERLRNTVAWGTVR
jgi:hypothetical protein